MKAGGIDAYVLFGHLKIKLMGQIAFRLNHKYYVSDVKGNWMDDLMAGTCI